ncbi:hypothetical protein [Methylobacterium oryzihabitans]|uniref:BioF2-like acetyltransferase domain-containing protein n=1 Tax=Methylobacterium oryzihabitans TaxID=2499852 RepID=A0A3S2W8P9_9HYPH|nr:hypothetical protein [Methylobacterium oryzihabitans]RVU16418.1 hypothetical protein EOE48_17185 [Methylobacterium oryzihabitans]
MTTTFSVIQGGAGAAARGGWRAELRRPRDLDDATVAAWRDLVPRSVEPSAFAEPDFVLTMAQHLGDGAEIAMLLVWRPGRDGPVLAGVLPLHLAGALGRVARLWPVPLADGAAPVLDAAHAAAALRTALDHLDASPLRVAGLAVPDLETGGALAAALGEAAAQGGRRLSLRRQHAATVAAEPNLALPRGRTSLERVRDPHRIRDAVEHFLVLEARRPADCLLDAPDAMTAFRVVTRLFAARRQCCVDLVRRDGVVVAAAVHLGSEGHDRVWRQAGLALATAAPARRETVEATVAVGRGWRPAGPEAARRERA